MCDIIKQIEEYDDGEYCSALFTIILEDDETIEMAIAREFSADQNYYDFSPTGKWFRNKGRVIDTCSNMYLIRQTAILDC